MAIQAQLDAQALAMLPLTSEYIEEVQCLDARWAANLRGMAIQAILRTTPPLVEKNDEQLNIFDLDLRNSFYRRSNDVRFDVELYERDLHN